MNKKNIKITLTEFFDRIKIDRAKIFENLKKINNI